ncbi:MAG: undecaprenyl/decaprenyl-phosphate alpha-N-acetylglucosaminyl 1-phosphate transferase [Chloroflexi bacterium]|nr:undecaprenyl/decaprenyl-phosphate alpha-N-acetylglucosaminyl 1-phosphate transferase [Chloroflexota bacterium]
MGLGLVLLVTPLVRRLAVRLNVIDRPVGLKIHQFPTPLLGGVAVYVAFAGASIAFVPPGKPLIGLLLGGLAAVIVGVLDDRLGLRPLPHLLGQIAAALVAILAGVGIVRTVSDPFAGLNAPGLRVPAAVGLVLTLFWLVGMMNAVNFVDGLDGLATGVAALATLMLAVWASEPSRFDLSATLHHDDLLLPLALGGALLGFLPYNWHVARIFLGDSGALFLGLAIGALSIIGPAKLGTGLLVLLVPVLDVAWAIVRRQLSGRSFLAGDKQHVYHRMRDLGLKDTHIVLLLYSLCLALALLDLFLVKLAKLVAFVVLALITGVVFVLLEVRASRARGKSTSSHAARASR